MQNLEQLLLFELEVKCCVVRDLESLRKAQSHWLLGIPVHENPSKDRARYEIALVWKVIETKRATTGQVEVMQHLCDGHRSPLPWIRWCDPENPVPKLVEFFFGEERVPVHLLHSEVAWNVFQHRKARHPKVARERLSDEARGFRFRELYWALSYHLEALSGLPQCRKHELKRRNCSAGLDDKSSQPN